jgi:hypothetical protein
MFFENDRTFCENKECKHTECYRHLSNVIGEPMYLSLAMFEGTKECEKEKANDCK